jgi:hypothetical protein
MDEMIRQIRGAADAGLYYLALLGALTLPDICAGLAAENGKTTGPKYKAWLRQYVPVEAADADLIYGLRCSLLHEGRAWPHGSSFPIVFTMGSGGLHNLSTEVDGERVGWYKIELFVADITNGTERWLRQFENTTTVKRNLEKFARVRPDGWPPHFGGSPVIG